MKENQTENSATVSLKNRYEKYRGLIFVGAFYALAVILMTWPLVTQLNSQLPGDADQWVHLWTFNWVKEAFFSNPFYTTEIFYPVGVSLATHNIAWLNIMMWLPLQAIFGEIAAYNLVFIAILTLNGAAIFLLAHDLTSSRLAAFIAGLMFAIWPFILSHHDHPNMIFVSWLPLALLFLKRALTNRTRRDVWLAIIFIALINWARLHLLIMGSLLLGLYALYLLANHYDVDNLKRLVFIVVVSGLLALPAAVPVALSQLNDANPDDIFVDEQWSRQTDLLSYVVPSFYHPLWGKGPLADKIHLYDDHDIIIPRTPFLGYTLIFLALSAFLAKRRENWFWGMTAVLYLLIALGPILRINEQFYPEFPMPYRLIGDFYLIRILRQPQRFNIILGIPLVILAAQGAKYWFQRLNKQQTTVTAVLLTGVILFEYAAFPYPLTNYTTPSWFAQLADDPEEYAILNLPVGPSSYDKRYMFAQLTHGKPIVNGKVARVPDEALAFVNQSPFLRSLFFDETVDLGNWIATQALRPLAQANIRYLVLHKDLLSAEQLAAWQRWLSLPPAYEDEFLAVYPTAPQVDQDFAVSHTVTDELSLIQADILTAEAPSRGLVQAELLWYSTEKPPADYEVCFYLQHQAALDSQIVCDPPAADWPTTTWEANDIVPGSYSFQIDPSLPSGSYEVSVGLQKVGEETAATQPIPLSTIQINQMAWPIQWDNVIELTEYDVQPARENLELTFYWRAVQEMETSYKIFLHIYDPERDELVSQLDTYPVNWTYFTNQWQAGEIVEDQIRLPLQDLPAGNYQLFIGFYDEESGERLATNYPDNSVPLTNFNIVE
ncbi:MAG: hypothetical protein CL608_18285 [Anaerolineaceae bacterium]|nr:hypothetical protein [Anaerolineaceae bacterium]